MCVENVDLIDFLFKLKKHIILKTVLPLNCFKINSMCGLS